MEEKQTCYVCYEVETRMNPYVKEPSPCICKGSLVIHKQCLDKILKSSRICGICKTKYNSYYIPMRNGLEIVVEVNEYGDIIEYTVDEEGDKQGEQIEKTQSGEILSITHYKNGLLHGKYTSWYPSGQIECECHCINNKIEGELKSWHPNGVLMEYVFFRNGLKDGQYKRWDDRGHCIANRIYIDGEIPGIMSLITDD
jgi:hypothetical protein